VRKVLQDFDDRSRQSRSRQDRLRLIAQGIIGVWLIALALHLAEVGLIGLSVIILATTFSGSPMNTPSAKRLPKRCRLPRC
jgi:NhaB family Na+:H+ antiporter